MTASAGKRILEVVIDIPFALPTIVAGLVLLSLYGPSSPLGVDWANTRDRRSSWRSCSSPCRSSCGPCSRCCWSWSPRWRRRPPRSGASRFTMFRLIILPSLAPAITSGAALSFARAHQ